MATYTGFIVSESLGYFTGVDAIAPGLGTPVPQLWGGIAALAGTLDQATPVPMVQEYGGVIVAGSPLDHIFGHLYVSPLSFDVGNLTGTTQHTLDIWNASLDDAVCTDVIRTGMEGISVGLNYNGFTLDGLASLSVPVTFMMDGPPIIDGALTLVFLMGSAETSAQVTFAGRRIVAFVWRPQTPILETLEWLTDILEAYDGSEQRIRLRNGPRQAWDISLLSFDPSEQSEIETAIYGWHGRSWALPIWMEQIALEGPLAAGIQQVSLDTTTADFRVGGMAMLWQSPTTYEILVLTGVTDTTLVFSVPTTVDFAAGTVLAMPVRTTQIAGSVKRDDYVSGAMRLSATFRSTEPREYEGSASATQFEGADVLLDPLIADGEIVSRSIDRPRIELDYDTGQLFMDVPRDYSTGTHDMRWALTSREGIWAMRMWLHRRAGRAVPVWVPSWRQDLQLTQDVGDAHSDIRVKECGYSRLLSGSKIRHSIMVELADGTRFFRSITGSTSSGDGTETLAMNASFGRVVPVADVLRISWFTLSRLNADRIEISWDNTQQAKIVAPVKEIAQ